MRTAKIFALPVLANITTKQYPDNFSWAGSRDYTAWMTIAKGLELANTYKQNGADTYCRDLMIWAKDMLAQTFCVADIADDDMVGKMGGGDVACIATNP